MTRYFYKNFKDRLHETTVAEWLCGLPQQRIPGLCPLRGADAAGYKALRTLTPFKAAEGERITYRQICRNAFNVLIYPQARTGAWQ